ncbi:hypothetical protein EG329_011728 [Mollisiaceae sp. DMI_Dod_QoI]|nr:hypothetical protein EG329_011728 [Helotiales sp. DMI_Dod_QoI]
MMQFLTFLYPALLALLTLSPTPSLAAKKIPKDAILLSQVKTLTLRSNAKTSHRRVSAIPQLTCKGPACSHYKVDVMRCTNQGSSYGTEDVEWSCTATMPEDFKLGSTEVICEGYSSPDDPYVLKGSCGVEYRLVYTDKGEEKYGGGYKWPGSDSGEGSTWFSYVFIVVFLGVLFWILYSAWQGLPAQQRRNPRRPGGFWGGGWGGGGGGPGGGDPWDPPPPYPGRKPYGSDQEGWRPGFWSGTAAGAAAGYLAGRTGNRQQEPLLNNNRGSSWFGGNSGNNFDTAPRRSASSSSSSARHESTGFGSTSRR